jgi:hypothetical protein
LASVNSLSIFFYILVAVPKLQFWNSNLRFTGKAGFRPLFPGACGKTMGFWNRLIGLVCYMILPGENHGVAEQAQGVAKKI